MPSFNVIMFSLAFGAATIVGSVYFRQKGMEARQTDVRVLASELRQIELEARIEEIQAALNEHIEQSRSDEFRARLNDWDIAAAREAAEAAQAAAEATLDNQWKAWRDARDARERNEIYRALSQ